ncbi:MAG: hypothetical protein QOF51_2167, partial [Chloroflexota bacterium]|nr:hypothetical protein [Chloroflexota bacterium]
SRTSGGTTSCAVYDTTGGLPMLRTEAQGSVRVVTDSLGNTIESYGYDEFGASLFTYSATPPNNVASQPRQYTAEPRDGETGLIYLRARMYDPSLGRFLQRDTYRGRNCTPASLSRYVFVSENPVTSVDPSGHGSVGPVPELRATKIIQCAPNEPAWWYVEIPPGVGYVKTLGVAASGRPVEPTYPLICNAPGPDGFCWTAVAPFWIDAGVFLSVEFWYSAPMLETAAGCGEPPDWVQKWML